MFSKLASVLAFPVGLLICFGPALYAWVKAEMANPEKNDDQPRRH